MATKCVEEKEEEQVTHLNHGGRQEEVVDALGIRGSGQHGCCQAPS
jgi:hypothetical protein